MTDDPEYKVGYGKPPRHSQFKKGQSGYPKGRPKGSKNLANLIRCVLKERVTITENGKRRTITKLEAMTKQLANKGASGDPKATQLLLGMVQLFEDRQEAPAQTEISSQADQQIMQLFFARARRVGGSDEGNDA
jgi:type II secretory pathway component PulC